MIDLHLHLDGSLPLGLAVSLAKEQGMAVSRAELAQAMTVPKGCQSLDEYLRRFELPVALLQSGEALQRAAGSLARQLEEQGLLYAEIRFAPQLHTQKGLTQRQAVEAVLSGLKNFPSQVILCCMRGGGEEKNRETVKLAEHFLGQGVCALDLAGAEAAYPTEGYRKLFAYAAALKLPFTIHAGEADGPSSIRSALSFGASRIGHGVRAIEDPALVAELAERKIPLEMCCTSNIQTKAVASLEDFPLREFLRQGVKATLNTDNSTVSGVTLSGEYQKLGLTEQERAALWENAAGAAFLPEQEKKGLLERLRQKAADPAWPFQREGEGKT